MPIRTNRGALTLVAAAALFCGPTARADDARVVNKVNLQLRIAGLGKEGCEIQIKPAHPGCKFKPVAYKVRVEGAGEVMRLKPIEILAESTSADHDCVFAITIKEPGRPSRTSRRSIRLSPQREGQDMPVVDLPCYLTSPTLASTPKGNASSITADKRMDGGRVRK